jgi:hypothetical protein
MRPLILVAACVMSPAFPQTFVGVSGQIGGFHLAVANYFGAPRQEVVILHDRRIPNDEIPVALFIAQQARVAPSAVVDLRLRGKSWWDISVHFGISPEVYYIPVAIAPGPPYGKAYGHFKKPKHQWRTIVLADPDLINMVNLRFLSGYHHVAPERVIELRGGNRDFVAVHAELGNGRHSAVVAGPGAKANPGRSKAKGHGH